MKLKLMFVVRIEILSTYSHLIVIVKFQNFGILFYEQIKIYADTNKHTYIHADLYINFYMQQLKQYVTKNLYEKYLMKRIELLANCLQAKFEI